MSRSHSRSHLKSSDYTLKIIGIISLIVIGIMGYIIYNKKECPKCEENKI